jgi:hypothetical protein
MEPSIPGYTVGPISGDKEMKKALRLFSSSALKSKGFLIARKTGQN